MRDNWFARTFNITERDLESWLAEALSRGGEYADLYFEHLESTGLSLDDGIVKSATHGVTLGVGVRVIAGERTGYAYTDNLAPERIRAAARTAACIAEGPAAQMRVPMEAVTSHNLYPVAHPAGETPLAERVALLRRADEAARGADARVFQVQASVGDSLRHVLLASSDGRLAADRQPMVRLNVLALVRDEKHPAPQRGYAGGGGRTGLDLFAGDKSPEAYAREAVRQAVLQLEADEAPSGEMTVVLGPGWPGILLHEAVGHGLEADFNRRGVSAFSNRMGQTVASPLCTVVDDGTIPSRRGSLNVDDEGTPTRQNVLIENGVLRGYLHDRLSSRLLKTDATGNGRRENYQNIPMPRMTNTYLLPGESDPEEILRTVPRGLYCAHFGGGQVDIVSGNFVFSATECYLIEDGRLTRPVRGASLIGNGPEALKHVSMVGRDLKLDEGVGLCGKEGQSVPVGVGIPTVKIDRMTVGGTR